MLLANHIHRSQTEKRLNQYSNYMRARRGKLMKELRQWIDGKFAEIAKKLPALVEQDCGSFSCGHAMGYKQALLDLDMFLEMDDCELISDLFKEAGINVKFVDA
jgi:hypothetical protein